MVRVDFREYESLSACPIWWINFVMYITRNNLSSYEAFKEYGRIIPEPDMDDIQFLEFNSENDYNQFRLFWMLYGK